MIDMGNHKGHHLFHTGGKSIKELMEDGELVAIPDKEMGMIFKRPQRCTTLELMAKLTVEEALAIEARRNAEVTDGPIDSAE